MFGYSGTLVSHDVSFLCLCNMPKCSKYTTCFQCTGNVPNNCIPVHIPVCITHTLRSDQEVTKQRAKLALCACAATLLKLGQTAAPTVSPWMSAVLISRLPHPANRPTRSQRLHFCTSTYPSCCSCLHAHSLKHELQPAATPSSRAFLPDGQYMRTCEAARTGGRQLRT